MIYPVCWVNLLVFFFYFYHNLVHFCRYPMLDWIVAIMDSFRVFFMDSYPVENWLVVKDCLISSAFNCCFICTMNKHMKSPHLLIHQQTHIDTMQFRFYIIDCRQRRVESIDSRMESSFESFSNIHRAVKI